MVRRRTTMKSLTWDEPIQTKTSFILSVLGLITMTIIIFVEIPSEDPLRHAYGQFAILHVIYCIMGIIYPLIRNPTQPFKKDSPKTFQRSMIVFGSNLLVQIAINLLSVTPITIHLYHIVSGISETLFYQVFLVPFGSTILQRFKWKPIIADMTAVIASAFLFAGLHFTYRGDLKLMSMVLIAGLVYGTYFVLWKDPTPIMIAHVLNNIIGTLVVTP